MFRPANRIVFYSTLFSSTRMLIGAYSTLFLVSRGVAVEHLIVLKGLQAAVIIIAELPFGYFADRVRPKISVLLSVLFASLWMGFTAYSPSVAWLYLGEVFNGLSLAAASGAVTSILIYQYRQDEGDDKPVKNILGKSSMWSYMGMIFAIAVGSLVPSVESSLFWWIGSALLMCQFLFLSFMIPSHTVGVKHFSVGREIRKLLPFFTNRMNLTALLYLLFTGLHFQILIQYWQPMARAFSQTIPESYQSVFYGAAFIVILGAQSLAGFMISRFHRLQLFVPNVFLLVISTVFLYLGLHTTLYVFVVVSTIILFYTLASNRILMEAIIHEAISDTFRSSFVSFISFITRILIIAVVPLFVYLFRKTGFDTFIAINGFAILLCIFFLSVRKKTPHSL